MLKRIFSRIKSFFYALPFGMKAADDLMATSNVSDSEGTSIQQKVHQKNVYADLLRGEVTQEVEELRYETFVAEELSNNYIYVGNGQAIKIDESETKRKNRRLKFIQTNAVLDYSVDESMKKFMKFKASEKMDYPERRLFRITYDDPCVRFRLENHIVKAEINLRNGISTKFYFLDDKSDKKHVPLINAIKKAESDLKSFDGDNIRMREAYVGKNEILSSMREFEFSTFHATNNVPNGIFYKFTNPKFEEITENGEYIVVVFSWEKYEGGQLLSEKYHSKTAEEKFKNKAPREGFALNVDFSAQPK